MAMTRYGVCYNLKESPYSLILYGYEWFFSTAAHMENFRKKSRIRRDWLNDSLTRRFKVDIEASELALFQLYQQVETRGFYVVDMYGNVLDCPECVEFEVVRSGVLDSC